MQPSRGSSLSRATADLIAAPRGAGGRAIRRGASPAATAAGRGVDTDAEATLDEQLTKIGWRRDSIKPVVEVYGGKRGKLAYMKDTHSWAAARALALASSASGCEVRSL